MKSRLVILSMLVFGMLLSTAGAGLAVSGLSGEDNASVAQYGKQGPQGSGGGGGGGVLGDQDTGDAPADDNGGSAPAGGEADNSAGGVQPARQVEAGAEAGSGGGGGGSLPFTGFAALPILIGGIALLSAGLILRRRTAGDRH